MKLYGLLDQNGRNETFCNWIGNIKLYKIIVLLFCVLVIVPFLTHYYLSNVDTTALDGDIHRTRAKLEALEDFSTLRANDLKMRIEEMLRIKSSVSLELRNLEAKKQTLQSQVTSYNLRIEDIKSEMIHQQMELERLKISVQQAQVAQQEAVQRNTPELALPVNLYANDVPLVLSTVYNSQSCSLYNCWNYTRCSITSEFPVYFYKTQDWEVESFLGTTLERALGYNPHLVNDPNIACAYIVLIGESPEAHDSKSLSSFLSRLPYWAGDGRNHILLNLARRNLSSNHNIFTNVNTGRALIVQSTFLRSHFRTNFDVVVPPVLGPPGGDVWHDCPFMLPARRKYLLSFQGQKHTKFQSADTTSKIILQESDEQLLIDKLLYFKKSTNDLFLFHFACQPPTINVHIDNEEDAADFIDWMLCGTESTRAEILRQSTFALIIASPSSYISTTLLQARLYEALKAGAVPVILGGDQVKLPFDEVIVWKRAVLLLPKARITEMHYLLRSVPDNELLLMRRQGRMLWETYLSSLQCLVDTVIANMRDRLGIPPKPVVDEPSPSVFNETFVPLKTDAVAPEAEPEESLGPLEPPYASPTFRRNYTYFLTQGTEIWNDWINPFRLYSFLPFDPVLPSDAKFIGSAVGFRPIGKGAGGAGKEFCESLGGNHPREQFTIVMLTYEREQVLLNSISRLYGLPYLNKVVVVWNSPRPPLEDLRWPDIGVPVQVVRAKRNSLNNRFLPYEAIETEAILSVDDDAHLRHDEIMFGFRVWREQRDRVVGFPGRYHAWDLNHGGWLYNSNYSCELSMVLTGAAFFHKYYTYLYTHWLPQAIRDKVDQYMNCEDIAMNFLVSHFTRKPPVKVTSRWTFRCPGCPVSLSEDDTHFQERHKCIQFFTEVFGYTPLLNTQYRADSILFKTRIPHDKQKCFKFI